MPRLVSYLDLKQRRRCVGSKTRALLWVALLAAVCGAVIWHVIDWHNSGMHLEIFRWAQTGRGHIAALYNVGLMLALGILLSLLAEKTTVLIARLGERKPSTDDSSSAPPE